MVEFDDLKKSVTTFVFAHHAAASKGKLNKVVNNYAERVDHFRNGIVSREFIYKDETDYHRKYKFVWETVRGRVAIRNIREGLVEVSYVMGNEWQRLSDNLSGSNLFRVTLNLENQPEGWKIVKHRADKQN